MVMVACRSERHSFSSGCARVSAWEVRWKGLLLGLKSGLSRLGRGSSFTPKRGRVLRTSLYVAVEVSLSPSSWQQSGSSRCKYVFQRSVCPVEGAGQSPAYTSANAFANTQLLTRSEVLRQMAVLKAFQRPSLDVLSSAQKTCPCSTWPLQCSRGYPLSLRVCQPSPDSS